MPIITIKLAKGRSLDLKRQLVQAFTEAAVKILAVQPEWVTIIVDEYDRENWASCGELHADKFGNSMKGKDA